MIQATLIRYRDNSESVEPTSHAGGGEYDSDIVCAVVSTLLANLISSLEALTDCSADLATNEIDSGHMKIDIPHVTKKTDGKVQPSFGSFLSGMINLTENSQELVSVQVIVN